MKKILTSFIWICILPVLWGQLPTSKEIVLSGEYYFCKQYGQDTTELKHTGKSCVLKKIKGDKKNEMEYEPYILFQEKKLTGQWRVLAYVAKDLSTARKLATIVPASSDNKEDEEKNIVEENYENTPVPGRDKNLETKEAAPSKKDVSNNGVKSIDDKKEQKDWIINREEKTKSVKAEISNIEESREIHPIINRFVECEHVTEAWELFKRLKSEGKISGGRVSKRYMERHRSDDFNIIMIDPQTGKVVGVFIKDGNENLKHHPDIRKADPAYPQIWFQINE